MNRRTRSRWIRTALILYVLLFAMWWTKLLYDKNKAEYETRLKLLRYELIDSHVAQEHNVEQAPAYMAMLDKYKRQRSMIIGEGIVFFMILAFGIWVLNRAWRHEVALARQQRNFLLSITHELKSPLASIRLAFDTLRKRQLNQNQVKLISKNATKDVDRLHDLVNNILIAARLESRFELSKLEVNINDLVENLVSQMRNKFPNTRFALHIDNDKPIIKADQMALTSVVINLLENAVKYCPSTSESGIEINLKRQQGNIILEVADQGIGIPDEEKQNVFKKFYRIGNEDTRETKGTGLGLYIVKSIIQAHRGSIEVKDNKPQGAIFHIKLPAA